MQSPDTVVDALRLLREEGFTKEFQLVDGNLTWDDCRCAVGDVDVVRLYRFEGQSDPGDEMVVFALVDPTTGDKGVLASGFGAAADPQLLDHLQGLASRQRPS